MKPACVAGIAWDILRGHGSDDCENAPPHGRLGVSRRPRAASLGAVAQVPDTGRAAAGRRRPRSECAYAPAGRREARPVGELDGRARRRTARAPPPPEGPPRATFFNVGAGFPDGLPFRPWAKALLDERRAANSKDNPDVWTACRWATCSSTCTPSRGRSSRRRTSSTIIYEANYGLRQIYLDGRPLPPLGEPQPWWYGYSVGRWEGDTLVVESNNFLDGGWLDVLGQSADRSGQNHRAVHARRVRRAEHRDHDRRPEGLHRAVHGRRHPAHHGRPGADRVHLQRVQPRGRAHRAVAQLAGVRPLPGV